MKILKFAHINIYFTDTELKIK